MRPGVTSATTGASPIAGSRRSNSVRIRVLHAASVAFWVVVVMSLRWDQSLYHFDFQVFRAANALIDQGVNPYDPNPLNAELTNAERYGPHWTTPDAAVDKRMVLLHPPTWMAQIRWFGESILALSLFGLVASFATIGWMGRDRHPSVVMAQLAGASILLILTPGQSTFRFGQIGLLVAGLVGLRILAGSRPLFGAPIAFLSFKPHLALASGIAELTARPTRTSLTVGTALMILMAAAATTVDPALWTSWLDAVVNGEKPTSIDDMSLRTLSGRWHLPMWTNLPLLVLGLSASAAACLRWRRADHAVLVLLPLALTAYASGHAFAHDWLWIMFIPAVLGWNAGRSLLMTVLATMVHVIGVGWSSAEIEPILNPRSLLGLGICILLAVESRRSHRQTEDRSAEAASDDRHLTLT